jgi:CDP-alcohol phosphatidyltransferase
MISRRTCQSSILQSCSVLTRSSVSMDVSLRPKQWVRVPSSGRAFLSALPYKQANCRSLIWIPLSERFFNQKINRACHRNDPDRYQRPDRRLLVMVARANTLKSKSCIRCSIFRETSQKSSVTSEASSDESSNVVVSEPPAAQQADEGANPQIRKDPEPSSNSSYVVLQHWLEQLKSPPNMITASRILIIPFISYWIITQQTQPAIVGCIYAAVSDVLDGYLARRYPHMQTALGTYLDPLGTCNRFAKSLMSVVCVLVLTQQPFL